MQWKVTESTCGPKQLLIIQEQGENTPTIINFSYNLTGFSLEGTINFPAPIALSIGSGLTISDIVSCTGAISGNVLTISAIADGTVFLGMPISGNGTLPSTIISGFNSGTGGTGTYIVNQSQNVASTTFAASTVSLQLTSEQTQTIPPGQYAFEIWTISPDVTPIKTPVITGFFEINKALTVIS